MHGEGSIYLNLPWFTISKVPYIARNTHLTLQNMFFCNYLPFLYRIDNLKSISDNLLVFQPALEVLYKDYSKFEIKKGDFRIHTYIPYNFFLFIKNVSKYHKTAFIWVPWHFWHMLDKTKVSCMVKTHILSFMTPTLFECNLRDYIIS